MSGLRGMRLRQHRLPSRLCPTLSHGSVAASLALAATFWLAAPSIALAGMAEREPPVPVLWLLVIGAAALSWVMACRRWWLPLAIWVPSALFISSLIADFADPVIGPAVREELGVLYILEADLAGALLLVVPLMFANIRFTRKEERPRRPGSRFG
ncbi:hypothetical protein AncyloWKF20_16000 [Ancylobacter sp. WKF20]|uniref:hypothetical protein n=1 Tax=Ancylobacter sp. WKF20 TaxID=3039801 RepID=UPI00243435EF|nr:hypothetical protein [Ancylobacter sp. WKF20]WGD29267.1 hypothetical protein AncyloWKF20_16000 [Ancylobacter sp. WKF20]